MHNAAKETWREAKRVLTLASPGLFKWWINYRFLGYHKNSVTRCKCPEQAVITQAHILECQEYLSCFTSTAAEFQISAEDLL